LTGTHLPVDCLHRVYWPDADSPLAALLIARLRQPDKQTVTDAYVYLLGRAIAIRQEHNDLNEPGVAYNVIKYNPAGSADFVNPNLDVAYLEAWIAVDDQTPVLLEVPQVRGRYYTAQILDEWGEVITNINERKYPSHPFGKFALVAPGSQAQVPADAVRIELHSRKAKLLGRVELKTDPIGAMTLQKQFKLTPLGKPVIQAAAPMASFGNKELIGVERFDDVEAVLGSALDVSAIAAQMQAKIRDVAQQARDPRQRASNTELCSRFSAVRVRPAHRDNWGPQMRAHEWLLIEWPENESEPTKYFLSTAPSEATLEQLVFVAKMRWRIERDYQDLKQEFGLGHYEGRGWRGFQHHATLSIAAYGFLTAQRLKAGSDASGKKNFIQCQVPNVPENYVPRGSPARAASRVRLDNDLTLAPERRTRQRSGLLPSLQLGKSTADFMTQ